jgi:hypothetical protein
MDIANRFADGEDACNNKRTWSPEDDRGNRYISQRRRSCNYENYGSHSQVAAGYKDNTYQGDGRNSGYRNYNREDSSNNKKFQSRGSREYNQSPDDMLNRPCHIHYEFINGKRVSRHAMKDCKLFLKLQEVAGNKQAEARRQGYEGNTNNGRPANYQATNEAAQGQSQPNQGNDNDGGYIPSKGHITTMIQPVPKSHKEEKKHLSTSQFSNNIASSDYRIFALVRAANRIQQRRPPNNSTSARKCAPGTQSSDRRI